MPVQLLKQLRDAALRFGRGVRQLVVALKLSARQGSNLLWILSVQGARRIEQIAKRISRGFNHSLSSLVFLVRWGRALSWKKTYSIRNWYLAWKSKHGGLATLFILFLIAAVSGLWIPELQQWLALIFATESDLDRLRALFLAVGGALIGATAIVSSLVMFAMQVNIERMPHGLFRRLSSDKRVLSSFAGALLF